MYIKFDIQSEMLEWHKKHSIFDNWAIQNNLDALAATHIKLKS